MFKNILTNAVDEQTGKDQVKDVKQWTTFHFDDVSYVWIRFRTTAVIFFVMNGFKIHQIEFTVRLVVADVTFVRLLLQIDLLSVI